MIPPRNRAERRAFMKKNSIHNPVERPFRRAFDGDRRSYLRLFEDATKARAKSDA